MNVSLTPQLETMIRERVASGRYNNASEVVREALRLFEEQERRGELVDFTPELMDKIEREAEAAYQRGDLPDPDVCP